MSAILFAIFARRLRIIFYIRFSKGDKSFTIIERIDRMEGSS